MVRSNRLLLVGVAVTLLGAALVLALLSVQRDRVAAPGDTPAAAADGRRADRTGTDGTNGTDGGGVTDTAPRVVVGTGDDGGGFTLPEGTSAVAVTVDFQRSVAGLPTAGDRVDVYGRGDAPADGTPLEQLLGDVEVLTITGAAHESNSGAPTVVLAVPVDEVADLLGSHLTDPVYLTLRGRGADALASAGGDR